MDDLSELKSDFYAIVCNVWIFRFCFENESTVISNFWKQIVLSTANVVDKISRNSGCAL